MVERSPLDCAQSQIPEKQDAQHHGTGFYVPDPVLDLPFSVATLSPRCSLLEPKKCSRRSLDSILAFSVSLCPLNDMKSPRLTLATSSWESSAPSACPRASPPSNECLHRHHHQKLGHSAHSFAHDVAGQCALAYVYLLGGSTKRPALMRRGLTTHRAKNCHAQGSDKECA